MRQPGSLTMTIYKVYSEVKVLTESESEKSVHCNFVWVTTWLRGNWGLLIFVFCFLRIGSCFLRDKRRPKFKELKVLKSIRAVWYRLIKVKGKHS